MFDCLIIGAGKIAAHYDEPGAPLVLTHAHAIKHNPFFQLCGFYDTDLAKAELAAEKWGSTAFSSLEALPDVDIVVVCSPDGCHLNSLREALALKPKLVFLEKPIACTLNDAKEILSASKRFPIAVNFSRRFIDDFQRLALRIRDKEFGEYKNGIGYYGKGFVHNGSHMVDLIRLLLGNVGKMKVLENLHDCYPHDATKTGILRLDSFGKNIYLQGMDCRHFELFELDIFFETARIRILNGGTNIEISTITSDVKYEGYISLGDAERISVDMGNALINAYQNIYDFLNFGTPLLSTVKTAFTSALYG